MTLSSFKDGLRRFFLGKISVRGFVFPFETGVHPLSVSSSKRIVQVHPVRSGVRVAEAKCAEWTGMKAQGKVLDLFISPPKARNGLTSIKTTGKSKIKGSRFKKRRTKITDGKGLVMKLPQIRRNMASIWVQKTGQKDVIAMFYPLIKDGIIKSALEKESGSLYVWYNPSCKGKSQILCLVSDPGKRPPLSWKWL